MSFANLHLHTYFSDGLISPADLAKKVVNKTDLTYFAVTDHDTLSAIEPFYRSLNSLLDQNRTGSKRFIPGIELSLIHTQTKNTIHLLGYYPGVTAENRFKELKRIDSVLGDFCRYRAKNRAVKDIDGRIKRAFEMNLDGISDRFDAPETVIRFLRERADAKNRIRYKEAEKNGDAIQYPIPATYQMIIDHWEELIPSSTREKISLYVLRPDTSKTERLFRIYRSEGKEETEARVLAERNQGCLVFFKQPSPLKEMDVFEGLALLKKSGAVTSLEHPAVDHKKISYKEFDDQILYPLIEKGLDGIEVFYAYDVSYRDEAIKRYFDIARKHSLLISGGTDFHGDGRTGLSDVKLEVEKALDIIHKGQRH